MAPEESVLLGHLRAEVEQVHGEIEHLRVTLTAQQQARNVRHGWLKLLLRDLETNPRTQYRVHLWGVVYWLVNFPAVSVLFFGFHDQWLKLGVFITLMYSIYANMATDYGAMSAALAIRGEPELPPIPAEPPV